MDRDVYSNIPDSGGWGFDYRPNADYTKSGMMLGRIMVGKMAGDMDPDRLSTILSPIPMPRRDVEPVENCVSWTKDALRELQRLGCADDFDIQGFMDHALKRGADWIDKGLYPGKNTKENYTQRRFP